MKRWIHSSSSLKTTHMYNGHKILKITDCGQECYRVQNMPQDFYDKYWNGIFTKLSEAKKYVDQYERGPQMKKWIHASTEDVENGYYLVTAYYDNRYKGRADDFSSDDFEAIVDKVHEYCSDGYYVEVENMGSGDGMRFDPEKWMECVERFGEVPESIYNLSDD